MTHDKCRERYERLNRQYDELFLKYQERGEIIAERILGWKKHRSVNSDQEIYAPSPEKAATLRLGEWLSKFVDDAIESGELPAKPEPGPATKAIMEMLGTAAGGRDERLSITIECGGYEEYLGIDMINAFLREQGEPS
jgi:hypothetical protein